MPTNGNDSAVHTPAATADVHVEVEHRFAMIPEALLYDWTISPDALRVYGVLLRHGSDPTNCYPSHVRIATIIGRSKRSINAWVIELENAGWIERVARTRADGSPDSNGYRVYAVPRPPVPPERALRADERGGVRADQRAPSTPHSAPKESQVNESHGNEKTQVAAPVSAQLALTDERSTSPSGSHLAVGQNLGTDRDLAFVEFWNRYPRKEGKGQARRAWASARRRGVMPEMIVVGAERYRDDPNRDPAYTKHAATWLNGECWDDEPLPDKRADARPVSRMAGTMAALSAVAAGSPREDQRGRLPTRTTTSTTRPALGAGS